MISYILLLLSFCVWRLLKPPYRLKELLGRVVSGPVHSLSVYHWHGAPAPSGLGFRLRLKRQAWDPGRGLRLIRLLEVMPLAPSLLALRAAARRALDRDRGRRAAGTEPGESDQDWESLRTILMQTRVWIGMMLRHQTEFSLRTESCCAAGIALSCSPLRLRLAKLNLTHLQAAARAAWDQVHWASWEVVYNILKCYMALTKQTRYATKQTSAKSHDFRYDFTIFFI